MLVVLVVSSKGKGLNKKVKLAYGARQMIQADLESKFDSSNGQISVGICDAASNCLAF